MEGRIATCAYVRLLSLFALSYRRISQCSRSEDITKLTRRALQAKGKVGLQTLLHSIETWETCMLLGISEQVSHLNALLARTSSFIEVHLTLKPGQELHRSRCAFGDAPFKTFRRSASALATFPRMPFLVGLLGPTPPPPCHLSTSWLPRICK